MILSKFGQLFNYARTEKSKGRQFDGIGEGHGAHHGARHSALIQWSTRGYIYMCQLHTFSNIFETYRAPKWPEIGQKMPEMDQNDFESPQWSEMVGTAWKEVGMGSPMSRPTFWDKFGTVRYPQIWSRGVQK